MATLEGFINLFTSIIPNNLNPKQWIVRNKDVQGGNQNFATIQELVDFHPFKMKLPMGAIVYDFPSPGKSTEFVLMADPTSLVDSNENTLVTIDNYSAFWQEIDTVSPTSIRIYNYAPDGPGGGSPVYPYTVGEESNWNPEFDAQANHRWLRFRDDDIDDNTDGIFDNWTVPISLNSFATGDYVENRFQRYDLSKPEQDLTIVGDLEDGRFYVIITDTVTINSVVFEEGWRFTYNSGDTVVFGGSTVVRETNIAPPRSVSGLPNNEPVGWEDTPPGGTATLWMITGQKSVYGQLKSQWIIRKIDERPNYVRYSYTAEPDPNTLCDTTESAADGTPADTDLIAGGWLKTFTDQTFMAYRNDDAPNFTIWQIEKIAGESGEYIDNVFKLYAVNMDPDSASVVAPVTRTPQNEGWSDAPLVETATEINFISTARKYFDGTLKTAWSPPVPYTGKSTYQDINVASPGDEFKIDPNVVPAVTVPSVITVENDIFKGDLKVWEQSGITITYKWYRVYNDGTAYPADADNEASNLITGFDYVATSGTPGTAGYYFDDQRVTITPAAVTGKAVFRCVATLATGGDDDIIFEEEISILDITDGKDAKNLSVTADNQLIIYDSVATSMVPLNILLRAYHANLGTPALYWYWWNGASWTALTNSVSVYSALATTGGGAGAGVPPYFTEDASAEEARFAVSTHTTNPDSADYVDTFSDYITIGKSSAAGIGSPGVDSTLALLSNESHTVVIDNTTGQPFAGEITVSGKAITKVEMWDGITKLSMADTGEDVDVVIASDNPDITFVKQYGTQGSDAEKYAEVYISAWTADEISAVCTITLTYGSIILTKQFSISSTADAPGAIVLDIDCDTGFNWTPDDRTDKTVDGRLYINNVLITSGYEYRWLKEGLANLGARSTYATGNIAIALSRTDILSSANITCEVREVGETPALRTRTVKFTDVLDNQQKIAWTDYVSTTNADKIPDGTDPSSLPITPDIAVWYLSTDSYWETHQAEFQCYAEETGSGGSTTWVWTSPQDIRGEQGDQGPNGDYFFYMFKVDGTTLPASNADLTTMRAASWVRIPPGTGILYMTIGRFNGETNPPQGDGYPPNAAVPEDDWSSPIKFTATDGVGEDGTDGIDGDNGWSPVFAVVPDGATREVLQLIDWTGGTGTKPTITNQYVGTIGMVATKAEASNIKGDVITGAQEIRHARSASLTDDGVERIFSTRLKFTTINETKVLGFSGAVNMWGSNAAIYRLEFQRSATGSTYTTVKTVSIRFDVTSTSIQPSVIPFNVMYSSANAYHRIAIQRIDGSANNITGCDVEGKIYDNWL